MRQGVRRVEMAEMEAETPVQSPEQLTAHPQPAFPNTNEGLSVPALLTPSREVLIGDGVRSADPESKREKGKRVEGKKDKKVKRVGRRKDDKEAEKRVGENNGKCDSGSDVSKRLTTRDVDLIRWIGRHGVVSMEQVARRFWQKPEPSSPMRRRLAVLQEGGLLERQRAGWQKPDVLVVTSLGLRLAGVPLRPTDLVVWRLRHSLALVDLSEQLLAELPGSSWLTERELRVGGWRASMKLCRLPDGLLVQADGRRFAVELEASRKEAERIRAIATEYMSGLRGPNALSGVIWYARPELGAAVEHLQRAVADLGLSWAFDVRRWEPKS
jgi:predicted transcriptional regulator